MSTWYDGTNGNGHVPFRIEMSMMGMDEFCGVMYFADDTKIKYGVQIVRDGEVNGEFINPFRKSRVSAQERQFLASIVLDYARRMPPTLNIQVFSMQIGPDGVNTTSTRKFTGKNNHSFTDS